MATSPQPFLAAAPATRIARTANTTLFHLSASYYGDALYWPVIAQANGLADPWLVGQADILVPDMPPQTSAPSGVPAGALGYGTISGQPIQASAAIMAQRALVGIPNVQKGASVPSAGTFFVNASGYLVLSLATSGLTPASPGLPQSAQAILSTLPNVANGDASPSAGYFFVNSSGYVVLSQGFGLTTATPATSPAAQPILASLDNVGAGALVPVAGSYYVNASGFIVISQ